MTKEEDALRMQVHELLAMLDRAEQETIGESERRGTVHPFKAKTADGRTVYYACSLLVEELAALRATLGKIVAH